MGKLKRTRQKFHLSRTKAVDKKRTDIPTNFQTTSNNSILLNSLPENIFSGIEIFPEDLKQTLPESDARSVISSRQDVLKKQLSKKEKINLRRDMLMKKLEVVSQMRKETKKKRKPKAKPAAFVDDLKSLLESLPSLERHSRKKQPINKVKKSVPKMKRRQKIMLRDISVFKKILADPLYKGDPTGMITSHIQEKILQGTI